MRQKPATARTGFQDPFFGGFQDPFFGQQRYANQGFNPRQSMANLPSHYEEPEEEEQEQQQYQQQYQQPQYQQPHYQQQPMFSRRRQQPQYRRDPYNPFGSFFGGW